MTYEQTELTTEQLAEIGEKLSTQSKEASGAPTARKDDSYKADLSLCPLVALEQMARAFMLGEKKYGRYNYLNGGMDSHRLVAACMRHVLQWQGGEELDPESGHSHLGHALACLAMLLDQQKHNVLQDTRRKV